MSKMSQLHLTLDEQAVELGFENVEEALNNGYVIDYLSGNLVKQDDEQDRAHEAWLKEREHALDVLDVVHDVLIEINNGLAKTGDIDLVEAWSLTELAREIEGVEKFVKEAHD